MTATAQILARTQIQPSVRIDPSARSSSPHYSVEFFHIYTDETIADRHLMGLEYLREAERAWTINRSRIVLIDNYNPKVHITTVDDVLKSLNEEGMCPDYWAYEGSLIENAKEFLEFVTDRKLKKNYARYIDQHGKYPCSLLTATWYLTRLGYFDFSDVIHAVNNGGMYTSAARLVNLLPRDYKPVESRARLLIEESVFSMAADKIQDLFYPIDAGRAVDLF